MKEDDKYRKKLCPLLASKLVGEIGCVTENISEQVNGSVRILGKSYNAVSKDDVSRGRWVRVKGVLNEALDVRPLNIWLGSCCC